MSKSPHTPGVVGRNLRRLREAQKLTRAALAKAAGLSVPLISQLELGYRENTTLETVQRLADALGVQREDLTEEVGVSDLRPVVEAFMASDLALALPGGPLTPDEIAWLEGFGDATWARLPPTPVTIYHMIMARRAGAVPR